MVSEPRCPLIARHCSLVQRSIPGSEALRLSCPWCCLRRASFDFTAFRSREACAHPCSRRMREPEQMLVKKEQFCHLNFTVICNIP
jgi:hypothetical protein